MGSVSRLEPFWAKSSKVHNSKTKLKISLEVGFSYLRDRNVRTYHKISSKYKNLVFSPLKTGKRADCAAVWLMISQMSFPSNKIHKYAWLESPLTSLQTKNDSKLNHYHLFFCAVCTLIVQVVIKGLVFYEIINEKRLN